MNLVVDIICVLNIWSFCGTGIHYDMVLLRSRGVVNISPLDADNRKDAVARRTCGDFIVLMLYLVINRSVLQPAHVHF